MSERGLTAQAQDEIVLGIKSFALYGFPEIHSASFALLVYASCYLKAHHPAAFYASRLKTSIEGGECFRRRSIWVSSAARSAKRSALASKARAAISASKSASGNG